MLYAGYFIIVGGDNIKTKNSAVTDSAPGVWVTIFHPPRMIPHWGLVFWCFGSFGWVKGLPMCCSAALKC